MSAAVEASETLEAIENALEVLVEYQDRDEGNDWRKAFWSETGEGGAAIKGLELIRDRLRERGN
jgi:hypothetical protein